MFHVANELSVNDGTNTSNPVRHNNTSRTSYLRQDHVGLSLIYVYNVTYCIHIYIYINNYNIYIYYLLQSLAKYATLLQTGHVTGIFSVEMRERCWGDLSGMIFISLFVAVVAVLCYAGFGASRCQHGFEGKGRFNKSGNALSCCCSASHVSPFLKMIQQKVGNSFPQGGGEPASVCVHLYVHKFPWRFLISKNTDRSTNIAPVQE